MSSGSSDSATTHDAPVNFENWAFIALGSNLGDSPALICRAMERLAELSERPVLKSSLWRSDPVDCPPGSQPFINAVVGLFPRPGETPETLLAKLQILEKEFGRTAKKVVNEPRPLDLDLITFGRFTRSTETLVLPHPRAHLRRFVLEPLAEIAPDLLLPNQAWPVRELLARLGTDQQVIRRSHGDNTEITR
jgi:2-amino-4-hydroxy-6-hydroxymethyldihydropteridine diphosphokinase